MYAICLGSCSIANFVLAIAGVTQLTAIFLSASSLPKLLVNVFLQLVKTQSVSFFKSTVRFIFNLQALVCQVYEVVFVG